MCHCLPYYVWYIIGVLYIVLVVIILCLVHTLYRRKRNVYKTLEDMNSIELQNDAKHKDECNIIPKSILQLNTYSTTEETIDGPGTTNTSQVATITAKTTQNITITPSSDDSATKGEPEDSDIKKYRHAEYMVRKNNPGIAGGISPNVIKRICDEVLEKTASSKANKINKNVGTEKNTEKNETSHDKVEETIKESIKNDALKEEKRQNSNITYSDGEDKATLQNSKNCHCNKKVISEKSTSVSHSNEKAISEDSIYSYYKEILTPLRGVSFLCNEEKTPLKRENEKGENSSRNRRSASVSNIYDVVPNQNKPVKVKLFSLDDTALLLDKRKSCIIIRDKLTQYWLPLRNRLTYVNANITS